MADISDFKGSDIIDVRYIIARVEELREERSDLQTDIEGADEALDGTLENADAKQKAVDDLTEWSTDNSEELEILESLLSDLCAGYVAQPQSRCRHSRRIRCDQVQEAASRCRQQPRAGRAARTAAYRFCGFARRKRD